MAKQSKAGYRHDVWAKLQTLSKPVQDLDPSPAQWIDVPAPLIRCSIDPATGSEIIDGQKVTEKHTHTIQLNWRPGVTSRMRIVHQGGTLDPEDAGRIFNIESVEDWKNQKHTLICKCTEQPRESVVLAPDQPWDWQDDERHTWWTGDEASFFGT